jgi:hypothetical protein
MSKYGRLFTEDDVERILTAAVGVMGHPLIHGFREVIDKAKAESTFPADEPLFLLRGNDEVASTAVGAYLRECVLQGCDLAHTTAIERAYDAMMDFAARHPDRMKRPD